MGYSNKDLFSVQFLRNRKHTVIQCVQKTGASETEARDISIGIYQFGLIHME